MGIKTYRLELDAERHPVLVMENEDNYKVEPLLNWNPRFQFANFTSSFDNPLQE